MAYEVIDGVAFVDESMMSLNVEAVFELREGKGRTQKTICIRAGMDNYFFRLRNARKLANEILRLCDVARDAR